LPHPKRVPSLSFLPTSTVFSTQSLAGLLHPAASHGVRLVSSRSPTFADIRPSSKAHHPPELFPLVQRVSLSPGPLPSRRWSSLTEVGVFLDLRALLYSRIRCRRTVLPQSFDPMLPWAFLDSRPSPRSLVSQFAFAARERRPAPPKWRVWRGSLPATTLADGTVTVRMGSCFRRYQAEASPVSRVIGPEGPPSLPRAFTRPCGVSTAPPPLTGRRPSHSPEGA
jgi:hypothetical protein